MAQLPKNTPVEETSTGTENSESLVAKTNALASDFPPAEPKRKRGRPPGQAKKVDMGASAPVPPEANRTPLSPLEQKANAEMVGATVTAVIRGIDGLIATHASKYARALGMPESMVDETTESLQCTKEELDLINKSAAAIAEKYGMLGQYAPEMMLTVVLLSHGARSYWTINKLKSELARQMEERKKSMAGPSVLEPKTN